MAAAVLDMPTMKAAKGKAIKMPLSSLRDALTTISPAFTGATTIPVLKMVKIEAHDGVAWFTATNLDLSIQVKVATDADGAANFLMPSERFLNYVKLLTEKELTLSPGERRVTLKCGRATTQFPSDKVESYPFTKFGVASGVKITQAQLAELLRFTSFAVSDAGTKYTLAGALLESNGHKVSLVATDGHRMAIFTVAADVDRIDPIIVPVSMMHALDKAIDDDTDKTVMLGTLVDSIACDVEGGIALTHRQIVGTFPNYKAVIPSGKMAATMRVNSSDLLASLSRCVAMSDRQTVAVKMTFSPERIVMKAVDAEAGETEESVDLNSSDGTFEPFATGFKGTYITDALKKMGGEECELAFADPRAGLRVKYTTGEGGEFVYVVMPMRV